MTPFFQILTIFGTRFHFGADLTAPWRFIDGGLSEKCYPPENYVSIGSKTTHKKRLYGFNLLEKKYERGGGILLSKMGFPRV